MVKKHSIIIGGTKGVGRDLAMLLAKEGQTVTAVGRKPSEPSPLLQNGGQILGLSGDAEQSNILLKQLREEVGRQGKLSSLVFLQRYRGQGDSWAGELAVALDATKILIEGLANDFDPQGSRSIVIVTSVASTFVARNQTPGYHVTKAALRQLARYYAVSLGQHGIRVNTVSPCTFVKQESTAFYEGRKDLAKLYAQITPLGRIGTALEVAKVIAFLCGPESSFVTGQELQVDGGLTLMLQDALAREVAGIAG